MARKRMFDLEIINQDSFLDLPMEAKAIYFLLGMEADDEGFVAPRKILRLYGGTEDSLKILIAKKFILPFNTGVIVITDWKRNNYLDINRTKKTIYQEEMQQLTFNEETEKYEFNNCLTNVEPKLNQNRREENIIEQNNIEEIIIEEKNIDKSIGLTDSAFEKEFDILWKLYPNKKGKKEALRHYKVARKKGVTKETIYNGIMNYIDYIKYEKVDISYIKHGSSWFNQESWNDEYNIRRPKSIKDISMAEIDAAIEAEKRNQ